MCACAPPGRRPPVPGARRPAGVPRLTRRTTPSIVVLLDELCRRGVVLDAGRAQFVRALTTAGQGGPTHANDDYGNGMTSRRRDRAFARSEVLLEFLRTIDTTPASTAERIRGRRGLA